MLYVSLVRQFETLLFYVVTSRIEALVVWRHKFLNTCVEKVYRLLLQPIVYCRFHIENADFQSQSGSQFSVTHSGKNSARSVAAKRLFSRIFTSICCTRSDVTTLGRPLRLSSCTLSRPLSNCLQRRRNILLHRPHTLACEYRLVGYSWPVEIG